MGPTLDNVSWEITYQSRLRLRISTQYRRCLGTSQNIRVHTYYPQTIESKDKISEIVCPEISHAPLSFN